MTRSVIEPQEIRIDKIVDGAARLECTWNVTEIQVEDASGSHTEYEYDLNYLWWALPDPSCIIDRYHLTEDGLTYIETNKSKILGYVKAKDKTKKDK